MTYDEYIRRIKEEDEELLKQLGSDFNEEGIPYWEKWHKPIDISAIDSVESTNEKEFDDEYPIDTTSRNKVK